MQLDCIDLVASPYITSTGLKHLISHSTSINQLVLAQFSSSSALSATTQLPSPALNETLQFLTQPPAVDKCASIQLLSLSRHISSEFLQPIINKCAQNLKVRE